MTGWQLINTYPTTKGWESGPRVLLFTSSGDIEIGYRKLASDDPDNPPPGFWNGEWDFDAIYWMPLPEPPPDFVQSSIDTSPFGATP